MTNHDIDKNIIGFLRKNGPIHTKFIAQEFNYSWNTVQSHCSSLKSENKINGQKVGKVNLWWCIKE